MKPRFLSESELNTIRGKVLAGHATRDEILSVFSHLDLLESRLDDVELGEGWRERAGIPA